MKSKQQLLSQSVISVCNPDFPTPEMIEFIGKLGFDAVFLDCEHSSTDFKMIRRPHAGGALREHEFGRAAVEQRSRAHQTAI